MMRALVIALVATAALATGCAKKEEAQVPAETTTVVTPAPVVVATPEPTPAPVAGDTTVVTPAVDPAMDPAKPEATK